MPSLVAGCHADTTVKLSASISAYLKYPILLDAFVNALT